MGGIVGGDKYMVNNILFKFAVGKIYPLGWSPRIVSIHNLYHVDSHSLYGSDYAAMKVAGHELKGLLAYFNLGLRDLCLPLMVHIFLLLSGLSAVRYLTVLVIQALIDYRGFRLLAMSILPIKKSTIVYGSNNYGHTIHAENKKLGAKMRLAAKKLNIKPHLCGVIKSKSQVLCSPADLEGHVGEDGRTYLLVRPRLQ